MCLFLPVQQNQKQQLASKCQQKDLLQRYWECPFQSRLELYQWPSCMKSHRSDAWSSHLGLFQPYPCTIHRSLYFPRRLWSFYWVPPRCTQELISYHDVSNCLRNSSTLLVWCSDCSKFLVENNEIVCCSSCSLVHFCDLFCFAKGLTPKLAPWWQQLPPKQPQQQWGPKIWLQRQVGAG